MSPLPSSLPPILASYWKEQRERLELALERHVPPLGSPPPVLHEAMRYTLLAPGKRLRGLLVVGTAELFRAGEDDALLAACAVEMVHAASLILDDLPAMDDGRLRRGKPALHRVVGEATAILAAVALLNHAYDLILSAGESRDRTRRELGRILAWTIGAHGLVGGQIVDLEAVGRRPDLASLEFIHNHKTAALFRGAVRMGAVAGGARSREIDLLSTYAQKLGLAFQITDDLLDYSAAGKDGRQDHGHATYVDLCGIDGARRHVDDLIDGALQAVEGFGRRAERHRAIAEFVRARDR